MGWPDSLNRRGFTVEDCGMRASATGSLGALSRVAGPSICETKTHELPHSLSDGQLSFSTGSVVLLDSLVRDSLSQVGTVSPEPPVPVTPLLARLPNRGRSVTHGYW